LPGVKRARFIRDYGLRDYDAGVLTSTRPMSEYFEIVASSSGNPGEAAKWVQGDLAGMLNAEGKDITDSPVPPEHLGELVRLIDRGELSGKLAKQIFPKMLATGEPPSAIVEREGLRQISDTGALEKIVLDVLAGSPKQVEQYKGGKTTVLGYLVGQVMKATRGQANPQAVNELFLKHLD